MICPIAKGASDNFMSLHDHTDHVVRAVALFAKQYGFDLPLARNGAILHDLGKAHPAFQAMLILKPRSDREAILPQLPAQSEVREFLELNDDGERPVYRHELGSLGFLSLFSREDWDILIEMVVAHHKSVHNDKTGRGLLDLVEEDDLEGVMESHLAFWKEWSPFAIAVAKKFGVAEKEISLEEAQSSFRYAFEFVVKQQKGWSPWRGLLMGADHFASAYTYEVDKEFTPLFQIPNLNKFAERAVSTRAHLYPLSGISVDDSRNHTLVTAPTGAGKTDFLVRRCQNRIFYTLPFQASINSMYLRFKADVPDGDIRRLHSASRVNLEHFAKKGEEVTERTDLQRLPGATVKVLTPHQLASLTFCTPGYEALALDIRGQDVILDEVHTYSEESRMMILKLIEVLLSHSCRIHIGTATMPSTLAAKLISLLGGDEAVYQVSLPSEILDTFDRHVVMTKHDGEAITESHMDQIISKAVNDGEKILLVANRVKRAQAWFGKYRDEFPGIPMVLIHSRYRRMDRAQLEAEVIQLQQPEREGAAIAIATQVVEVSLDISYDRMITDAAPLDALIQRFGRVNRRRSENTIGKFRQVHVLPPADNRGDILPYDLQIVQASFAALQNGQVFHERNVQVLMDQVFPELPALTEANEYMVNAKGEYRLQKLQNQPKSTVVTALKIDGNSCILQKDLKAYQDAKATEKPRYEIPVPGSFAKWNKYQIEESGSYPLIIPDERYQFNDGRFLGLIDSADIPVDHQIL
jgi:CRISPR-associated endonuclease/helicase Cas3